MEIDIKQVLLQILNFGILIVVLNKFLYKPILNMLKTRENKINDGLKAADKNLKTEADLDKQIKSEVAKARKEAANILTDAKEDAKKQVSSIKAEAKKEAKKESLKHEKKMQEAFEQKEKELEKKLAKLVIATTENSLKDVLSKKDIEKITKATVTNLK